MDSLGNNRIIVLVDMDCFYVQVEQKLSPEYLNKPCAVVQYNTWKGGGIIAVNYEARARGVKRRFMRGDEAKRQCPEIHLFQVPEVRGKADLTRYREAGASVLEVLCEFSDCVERASIDEAYLDMTSVVNEKMKTSSVVSSADLPNTFVVGWDLEQNEQTTEGSGTNDVQGWLDSVYDDSLTANDQMLAVAAVITEKMRASVYERTGFKCSAGISYNKMLAKLACGLHKPNKQTILPFSSVPIVYSTLPVNKIRNLGGKLGEEIVEKLGAKTMGDLSKYSEAQLSSCFGEKTGSWLYNIAKGIDYEPVVPRQLPKSIGCGKNFPGKSSLNTKAKITHWVQQLASEIEERLKRDQKDNGRMAKSLTVTARCQGDKAVSVVSRSCPIRVYNAPKIASDALVMLQKLNTASPTSLLWKPAILSLAMVASKFEDTLDTSSCNIENYFTTKTNSPVKVTEPESASCSKNISEHKNEKDKISSFFSPGKNESEKKDDVNSAIVMQESTDNLDHLINAINCDTKDQNVSENKTVFDKPGTSYETNDNFMQDDIVEQNGQDSNSKVDTANTNSMFQTKKSGIGFFARKLLERQASLNINTFKNDRTKNVSKISLNSPEPHEMCAVDGSLVSFDINFSQRNEISDKNNINEVVQDDNSELTPEISKVCEKCHRTIPVWEDQEHSDYHLAVDMQKNMNTLSAAASVVSQSKGKPVTKLKTYNKRKPASRKEKHTAAAKKQKQKINTLDSYMK